MNNTKTPGAKILIVEDEAIVAKDIANKLERLGYTISGSTAQAEEALVLAREQQPDLVLMDIRLRGAMDGVEAAERMRRECDLAVIFLTAHSDRTTLNRAKQAEPFGYIIKPFETRDLEIHIEIALYKHQSERKLRESTEALKQKSEELSRANKELARQDRFIRATTDSLSAHVCVLNAQGLILSVNQAWLAFAATNPPIAINVGVGANYLAICDAATGPDAEIAHAFAAAIRAVSAGTCPSFEMEYPCHSPEVKRWFIGRVTPFAEAGSHDVVIAHENVTARKLAGEQQALLIEVLHIQNAGVHVHAAAVLVRAAIRDQTVF